MSETPAPYGESQPSEQQQRVIKFRAWDLEYSHMYENAWPVEHIIYVEMDKHDPAVQEYEPHMEEINQKWFYFIKAKDMALMQYTGLQDLNEREICGDDIITYRIDGGATLHTGVVSFNSGKFVVDGVLDLSTATDKEVIGNRYEHRHLLPD
jgi:uncharacterized phage protein (TIGR01671 family)